MAFGCSAFDTVVQIDTEGYDLEVLRLIDLARWQPSLVMYEHMHLDDEGRAAARSAPHRRRRARLRLIGWWSSSRSRCLVYPRRSTGRRNGDRSGSADVIAEHYKQAKSATDSPRRICREHIRHSVSYDGIVGYHEAILNLDACR